eukprot:NODE_7881_length_736_cov_95.044046_g7630_i0.p1 GENE.NODE_7881_length_736_cov_95.044046_g7630_i0~~NODE_7881_length_736_cov_95.044046_g7630_i0.p1  ORF type:complete len:186 (-),score=47.78 NODE_7881_length_736_cov_95.044046_g7630_i0:179-676(-)
MPTRKSNKSSTKKPTKKPTAKSKAAKPSAKQQRPAKAKGIKKVQGVKIDLAEKFASFTDIYQPKIIGELNGQHVKLAKLKGPFTWHSHEKEDEMFLVIAGKVKIWLRDGAVTLGPGQMYIVPMGVEHRPDTIGGGEAHVMLLEPMSTLNTGNVRDEFTHENLQYI